MINILTFFAKPNPIIYKYICTLHIKPEVATARLLILRMMELKLKLSRLTRFYSTELGSCALAAFKPQGNQPFTI